MTVTIVYLVELELLVITILLALNGVAINFTLGMAVAVLPIYKPTHVIQVIKYPSALNISFIELFFMKSTLMHILNTIVSYDLA